MFRRLEGDNAVLARGGVFHACDLYEWSGGLYARRGTGYVRLYANGSTSQDGTQLRALVTDVPVYQDRFGRLGTEATGTPVAITLEGGIQSAD